MVDQVPSLTSQNGMLCHLLYILDVGLTMLLYRHIYQLDSLWTANGIAHYIESGEFHIGYGR